MGTMERIFRLMSEKQASDVFLSANAPVMIKINGQSVPVNTQLLPVDGPRNLLAEVVPPTRMEELKKPANSTWVWRFRVWGGFVSAPCASAARLPP